MLPFLYNDRDKLEYIFGFLVFVQRNPGRINKKLIKIWMNRGVGTLLLKKKTLYCFGL